MDKYLLLEKLYSEKKKSVVCNISIYARKTNTQKNCYIEVETDGN